MARVLHPGTSLIGWCSLTSLCLATLGFSADPPSGTETLDEPTATQAKFFEREIRPLLAERCFKCHGEKKQSGGLRLDIRANALAGGESGPAVVPGNLDESLLIGAVRHESFQMPPDGKLSDAQIAALEKWIKAGAPWPGDTRPAAKIHRPGVITEEDRQWWAFQPITRPVVPNPVLANWGFNEIDRFIAAKLEQEGLTPAPMADRRTLIRRVTFDLTGLPPTAEDVLAFEQDDAADAYERLVNRLLDSPAYGERWARHWLDLVRYAETDGYRADDYRPNAWRYRDYVIKSFNDDKPYDRFVQEQLAGDELFPGDTEALTATGYYQHGIYEYNSRDARGQWQLILDDITDTTGDVFLGMGVQCARCHDHKFDPILQADYYRLQAFFAGILPQELPAATDEQKAAYAAALQPWEEATATLRSELAELEEPFRKKARDEAVKRFPADVQEMINKPVAERTPYEHQVAELAYRQVEYDWARLERLFKNEVKDKALALKKQLSEFDKFKPESLPVVLAVTDLGSKAADITIPKKGKGSIDPGYLTILEPSPAVIEPIPGNPKTTGRRATLARWITNPANPLAARVMVNRVWQYHFGRGIAANASDFGRLGDRPTHPELLDWLASEFRDRGWRLKDLHRRIVLSATYRQSATHPDLADGQVKDPENRWYWRGNVRRLDAEQIRDALYLASGKLDTSIHGGPGAPNEQPRRSIFLRVQRNLRNPILDVFDAPLWMSSAASRHVTTTPIQSLLMINSQLLLQQAAALEESLNRTSDAPARLKDLYLKLYGRVPSASEVSAAEFFLAEQARRIDVQRAESASAKFEYDKIPYRDGQAAVVTAKQAPMRVALNESSPRSDFTIEAFVVLRSVYDSGAVRVITSAWSGNEAEPGWSFGVTGMKSRRKPQTLVLQLVGRNGQGQLVHDPIFSDHTIQLNKPYYLAASVRFDPAEDKGGSVTFFVKDLSNDDEPLQTAVMPHQVTAWVPGSFPLTIGGRMSAADARFDGLIDDVRLSTGALEASDLLFAAEATQQRTVGYWRFEPEPDVFADVSGHGLNLVPASGKSTSHLQAERQAWIDLCHTLLNSSEFLYVE